MEAVALLGPNSSEQVFGIGEYTAVLVLVVRLYQLGIYADIGHMYAILAVYRYHIQLSGIIRGHEHLETFPRRIAGRQILPHAVSRTERDVGYRDTHSLDCRTYRAESAVTAYRKHPVGAEGCRAAAYFLDVILSGSIKKFVVYPVSITIIVNVVYEITFIFTSGYGVYDIQNFHSL